MKLFEKEVIPIAQQAHKAARIVAKLSRVVKDDALCRMAAALRSSANMILIANEKDIAVACAKKRQSALIDRLILTKVRIEAMASSLEAIAALDDPVGGIDAVRRRPNGLLIGKMRVPIGVVGIIYEARPNVTSDCAALCLKSGNSVVLRGGSEAFYSNKAIVTVLQKALPTAIPTAAISFIKTTDRAAVEVMLRQHGSIDLIIPRGGESLIREVTEKSTIPVIKHYKGVCHVYVDDKADLAMARLITINAKVQRPGVCNAIETLLVHKKRAQRFIPQIVKALTTAGVTIRGCTQTGALVAGIKPATKKDWTAEYLDLILAVKVVKDLDEAIDHINTYGSHHSDAIITTDYAHGLRFLQEVDSAAVYINASTRFTDGGEFGLGAEMGISTDKLHARGPMGLEALTTYKYVAFGSGQIRT